MAIDGLAAAARQVHDAFAGLAAALESAARKLTAGLDAAGAGLANLGRTLEDAPGELFRRFGTAIESAIRPVSALAAGMWAALAPLQRLSGSLQPFLQALNPALANALSYAMRELVATFGLLITPIAQELVPVIKEVAAALQPVFRAMGPILAELMRVVGRVIALLARSFATILEAMAPVLTALLELFSDMMTALTPLIAAFSALVAALAPLLGALIKGLTPIFQGLAKAAVLLTAAILKTVGATGVLDNMIAALEKKDERGAQSNGLQAAQNVQFQGYRDFGRQLALSATVAARPGAPARRTQEDYAKDMLAELQSIRKGDAWAPLRKLIYDAVLEALRAVKEGVFSSANNAVLAGGNAAAAAVDRVVNGPTTVVGRRRGG